MDNQPGKWRRLQDHPTPPPAGAFARLCHLLFPADQDKRALQRLQHHSITPPAFLRAAIKTAVLPDNRTRSVVNYRRWITAAAACLLLVVATLVFHRSANGPSAHPSTANATNPAKTPPAPQVVLPSAATDSTNNGPSDSAIAGTPAGPSAPGTTIIHGTITAPATRLSIEGHPLNLVDNDLLLTFTSYRYPQIAGYISPDADYDLKIHMDQYTNITLSPAMAGFIKDLYGTRNNGKPTRKARKTKEKLEKWQATDQKRFDSSRLSNPLDPFDLADFLFR